MRIVLLSFFVMLLAACAGQVVKTGPEQLELTPVSFSDLKGWNADSPAAALASFKNSCAALAGKAPNSALGIVGNASAWQAACAAAPKSPTTDATARAYFEQWFRPYAARGNEGEEGLFTGYYVPELRGSLTQGGAFQTPLYAKPADMISVDLGAFKTEHRWQSRWQQIGSRR